MNKGILNKTKCYLAGNLENEIINTALGWRQDFKNRTKKMGLVCLTPFDKIFINFEQEESDKFHKKMFSYLKQGNLQKVHNEMKTIRRRDLAMIDHSSFIVCILNTKNPTYGTIEELSASQRQNKPTFIVIHPDLSKIPLWIAGMFKPECFYNSLDEVITKLENIDNGKTNITNENWRIFSEDYK